MLELKENGSLYNKLHLSGSVNSLNLLATEYGSSSVSSQSYNTTSTKKCIWNGREFSDYKEVIDYIKTKTNDYQSKNGSISAMDITKCSIKYLVFPMETGNSWSYYNAIGKTKKKVVLQESVTVPAGTFDTYKIQYDFDDMGIIYCEWFANDVGIIKEYMEVEIETMGDEGQSTGTINVYDTLKLSSYNIQ